jgi:hypothetical protein
MFRSRAHAESRQEMGYIPKYCLENLKKYSYKGVDRYVIILTAALSWTDESII